MKHEWHIEICVCHVTSMYYINKPNRKFNNNNIIKAINVSFLMNAAMAIARERQIERERRSENKRSIGCPETKQP